MFKVFCFCSNKKKTANGERHRSTDSSMMRCYRLTHMSISTHCQRDRWLSIVPARDCDFHNSRTPSSPDSSHKLDLVEYIMGDAMRYHVYQINVWQWKCELWTNWLVFDWRVGKSVGSNACLTSLSTCGVLNLLFYLSKRETPWTSFIRSNAITHILMKITFSSACQTCYFW